MVNEFSALPAQTWPAHTLAAELPDVLVETFVRIGAARAFTRGQVIIAENAHTTEVYLIVAGFVRVINYSASGDQAVIAIRTRGDLVGELAALDGDPRSSTVVAASRVNVRVIDAPLFRSFAVTNPFVIDTISRGVVSKLRSATRSRIDVSTPSVLARVARVLEHLADGYGRTLSTGLLIDIPLSQQDLASLVSASERGVSRAYTVLRGSGAIDVAYRRVIIRDHKLLQQYAGELVTLAALPATD